MVNENGSGIDGAINGVVAPVAEALSAPGLKSDPSGYRSRFRGGGGVTKAT